MCLLVLDAKHAVHCGLSSTGNVQYMSHGLVPGGDGPGGGAAGGETHGSVGGSVGRCGFGPGAGVGVGAMARGEYPIPQPQLSKSGAVLAHRGRSLAQLQRRRLERLKTQRGR